MNPTQILFVISLCSSLLPFAYLIYGLGRLQQRIDHMSKQIDQIVSDGHSIDERIDDHERTIAKHEEAIGTLKKKVGI